MTADFSIAIMKTKRQWKENCLPRILSRQNIFQGWEWNKDIFRQTKQSVSYEQRMSSRICFKQRSQVWDTSRRKLKAKNVVNLNLNYHGLNDSESKKTYYLLRMKLRHTMTKFLKICIFFEPLIAKASIWMTPPKPLTMAWGTAFTPNSPWSSKEWPKVPRKREKLCGARRRNAREDQKVSLL